MRRVYIDLSRLNPGYAGGVSRFSIGLAQALVSGKDNNDNVAIIASAANYSFVKGFFPNAKIIRYAYCPFHKYTLALISLLAYVTRSPGLLMLMNLFAPAPKELKEPDALVVCPTSTLNFYHKRIQALLCIHDIQHELYPENFAFLARAVRWAQYRLSAQLAQWIQVSSNAIRDDMLKQFGAALDKKIFIAPEGFDEKLFSPALPVRKPEKLKDETFVYYPAQLWKHKNHKTVIEGLRLFNKTGEAPVSLVLTGKDYGELNHVRSMAQASGVNLIYLGLVPEIEMRWLYKNAICSIAAGYHESSSLPVREAIACGGRILAADIPPNKDIEGLNGLYLFETFSPDSFAAQLAALLEGRPSPVSRHITIDDFRWSKIAEIYRRYF